MVYHWQSHSVKLCGVDDMVLLPRPSEDAIVDNLKKRFLDDYIYTSIGPVLISVNPFKQMPYFGEKQIEQYQGAALYENPPHIYGLSDQMFRNLLIDSESQCVIISGESGAGKTVAARYIMSYIAHVSGGSSRVQHVKDVVLNSNPLLEAFGNAKTIRNNNSSRFGKYVEIVFDAAGQPVGGRISNFLLEKSRVPNLCAGERNFHIFYQLCQGAHSKLKSELGLVSLNSFPFLCTGGTFSVEGINDTKDFAETSSAMKVMGFSEVEQLEIWNVVAAILHLGNISFNEQGNYACISDPATLDWPVYLLGIEKSQLESKLISRLFESKWGKNEDSINVTLNVEQAMYTRDALAKGIYNKLFDYLVQRVNAAMFTDSKGNNIGILDIYGFEILEKNGFEQLCINFVNEKLQQIFIQLTLKAEQEEYVAENIAWSPIDYFNNQVVCELLEGRQPPGLFLVLDDVCATMHAVADGADQDVQKKLNSSTGTHNHYSATAEGFIIKHYAGVVSYSVDGFCDRNRDVFFPDLVQLLQSSSSQLLRSLFPERALKTRPTTAGNKIRSQAGELVAKLMQCSPHYIRCIKPNESKRSQEWDELRVKHQVEYLGLRENICVRRAGFAYRRPFKKFLQRYAILTKESWPVWRGRDKDGVKHILSAAGFNEANEFQLGVTKIFIKNPETLFHLEELREQHYDKHAIVIQRAFKRHFARRQQETQRLEAAALVHGKKERRKTSIYRHFIGDYLGVSSQPELQALVGRRERIMFAIPVTKYDRRFKPSSRDLILTSRSLFLVCAEPNSSGIGSHFTLKRNIPFPNISHVTLSTLQDDFVALHVLHDYDSLLEIPLKTEFLHVLHKRYLTQVGRPLSTIFSNSIEFSVKKSGLGGGGKRQVIFVPTITELDIASLKINGATLTVGIGAGLSCDIALPAQREKVQTRKKLQIKASPVVSANNIPVRPAPARAALASPMVAANNIPVRPAPARAALASPMVAANNIPVRPAPTRAAPPPPTHVSRGPPVSSDPVSKHSNGPEKEECCNNPPASTLNTKSSSRIPVDFSKDLTNTIGHMRSKNIKLPGTVDGMNGRSLNGTIHNLPNPSPNNKSDDEKMIVTPPINFSLDLSNTIRRIKSKQTIINPEKLNDSSATLSATSTMPLQKPVPGGGRPRPPLKPSLNRVKAVYDYQAQDVDELNLKEGDFIELIKEHPGGWWQGRLKGKEGLFPANYVLKI